MGSQPQPYSRVRTGGTAVFTPPASSDACAALQVLCHLTLELTQVEFPAPYWNPLDVQPTMPAIVVTRNTLPGVEVAVAAWTLRGMHDAVKLPG